MSLKEYVEANKEVLTGSADTDTATLSIDVEGENVLVYTYKLKKQTKITDGTKKQINSFLDKGDTTFTPVIDALESRTTTKNISVKVIYKNADDSVIAEKEYKKS